MLKLLSGLMPIRCHVPNRKDFTFDLMLSLVKVNCLLNRTEFMLVFWNFPPKTFSNYNSS